MSETPERFSSIGRAVRSRIPVDAQGNFPVNRTLIAVLVFALALFNQALFWLLSVLLGGQGRPITAERFMLGSLALGAVLWVILVVAHVRVAGGCARKDALVIALTGGVLGFGLTPVSPGCALAAVALLAGWEARDIWRK